MDRLQKTQKNISNKKSLNRGSKGTLQSCPSSVRRFLVTNNHEIYLKRKEYYRQNYQKRVIILIYNHYGRLIIE